MYTHVYMHDLRAQDLPFLNGTNSFKGSLYHGMALAIPEGSDTQGSPISVAAIRGRASNTTDADEGSVMLVPPCLLGAM